MKRIRNAIAVLALAAAPLVALATPANAHAGVHVCAGTGELVMNAPLFYPVNPGPLPTLNPPTNTTFSGTLGVCVNVDTAPPGANVTLTNNVSGSILGACGRSTGSVSLGGHASASFQTAGSIVVVAGPASFAVANAVPVVGTSCLNGATRFQVTGAAVVTGP